MACHGRENRVLPVAAAFIDRVTAIVDDIGVVAGTARNRVVLVATDEDVVAARSLERVGAFEAQDQVVFTRPDQIAPGIAPCRERVCRYVSISGFAVTYKKQK